MAPPTHAVNARFGSGMTLVGYDLEKVDPTNTAIQLHWRADAPTAKDYTVFVHELDSSGHVVVGADSQPGGGSLPTSTWQVGETLLDDHRLTGTALTSGSHLEIGVYLLSTGERLPATDVKTGASIGDALQLPW
jgi:hypothetical protein